MKGNYQIGEKYTFLSIMQDPRGRFFGVNPIDSPAGESPWDGKLHSITLLNAKLVNKETRLADEKKTEEIEVLIFVDTQGDKYLMRLEKGDRYSDKQMAVEALQDSPMDTGNTYFDFKMVDRNLRSIIFTCEVGSDPHVRARLFHKEIHNLMNAKLHTEDRNPDLCKWTHNVGNWSAMLGQ